MRSVQSPGLEHVQGSLKQGSHRPRPAEHGMRVPLSVLMDVVQLSVLMDSFDENRNQNTDSKLTILSIPAFRADKLHRAAAHRAFVTADFCPARLMIATTAPASTACCLEWSEQLKFRKASAQKSLRVSFSCTLRVMRVTTSPCCTMDRWLSGSESRLHRARRQCCNVKMSFENLRREAMAATLPSWTMLTRTL